MYFYFALVFKFLLKLVKKVGRAIMYSNLYIISTISLYFYYKAYYFVKSDKCHEKDNNSKLLFLLVATAGRTFDIIVCHKTKCIMTHNYIFMYLKSSQSCFHLFNWRNCSSRGCAVVVL